MNTTSVGLGYVGNLSPACLSAKGRAVLVSEINDQLLTGHRVQDLNSLFTATGAQMFDPTAAAQLLAAAAEPQAFRT